MRSSGEITCGFSSRRCHRTRRWCAAPNGDGASVVDRPSSIGFLRRQTEEAGGTTTGLFSILD
jgi:hypothetical protein